MERVTKVKNERRVAGGKRAYAKQVEKLRQIKAETLSQVLSNSNSEVTQVLPTTNSEVNQVLPTTNSEDGSSTYNDLAPFALLAGLIAGCVWYGQSKPPEKIPSPAKEEVDIFQMV